MAVKTHILSELPTEPVNGKFYRLIRKRYADKPLSMFGSLKEGGRYNVAGAFSALYLGFDQETCRAEVSQGIASGLPFKPGAFVLWNYNALLNSVIRLDDQNICKRIGVTLEEITVTGDHQWAGLIGEPLYKRGVEGLVAPSAQRKGGKCLDIYLDNVKPPAYVKPIKKLGTWPPPSSAALPPNNY
ncbi:MAG: RES family NAD+ phosphorylase [bacterium]